MTDSSTLVNIVLCVCVFLARSADPLDSRSTAAVLFDKHCPTPRPFARRHVLLHILRRQKQVTTIKGDQECCAAFRKLSLCEMRNGRPP